MYTQGVTRSFVFSGVDVDIQGVDPTHYCVGMLSASSETLHMQTGRWVGEFTAIVGRDGSSFPAAAPLCFSVLDLEDAPLLQVVHLLEDERHVVAQLVEFRHGHLWRRKDGKHRRSSSH